MPRPTDPDAAFTDEHAMSPARGAIYRAWLATGLAQRLKARRLDAMDRVLGGGLLSPAPDAAPPRVLEVGCGSGRDFIRPLAGHRLDLHGIDLFDTGLRQENFTFHQGSATALPFPDGSFDIAVSIGVFEHLTPLTAMDRASAEIARVARGVCVVVPSVATRLEPHFWRPYWQLGQHPGDPGTHYLSDHTWRQLSGFSGFATRRHRYLAGLITNLMIYRAPPPSGGAFNS